MRVIAKGLITEYYEIEFYELDTDEKHICIKQFGEDVEEIDIYDVKSVTVDGEVVYCDIKINIQR